MNQTALIQKTKREKMAEERQKQKEIEEMKSVTFHPKILCRKQKSKISKIPVQERLYEYNTVSKQKLKEAEIEYSNQLTSQCTFRPKIDQK